MAYGAAAAGLDGLARDRRAADLRRLSSLARFLLAIRHSGPGDTRPGGATKAPGGQRAVSLRAQSHVRRGVVAGLRPGTALWQRPGAEVWRGRCCGVPFVCPAL